MQYIQTGMGKYDLLQDWLVVPKSTRDCRLK